MSAQPQCQTCRFWRPEDEDGEDGDYGRCTCENSDWHGMVLCFDEDCEEWERASFEGETK